MRLTVAMLLLAAAPALADGIVIEDAYALVARPNAPTGAVFMVIRNEGEADDRLVSVQTSVAAMAEVHTHQEEGGVMRMRPVEGGLEIAAGETRELVRGGDHVMLMGLNGPIVEGSALRLTLVFEQAGEIELDVAVDNAR